MIIFFKQQLKDKLCLNATILNEEECVAIIFAFVPMSWNDDLLFIFIGAHIMKTYALWRPTFGQMGWKSIHATCLV
jgi:hypothetical protein